MRTTSRLCAAAALLLLSTGLGGAAADMSAETAKVWERHVSRAMAGDLDAVMEDFGDDSAVITPDGVLEGKAAIRGFFADFLAAFDAAAMKSTVVNVETVHDDVVVSNFTIGTLGRTFQDTAIVRDDRIRVLTTIGYPAE